MDTVDREAEMAQLYEDVKSLPQAQAACLVMNSQGFTYQEIHQALGLNDEQICDNIKAALVEVALRRFERRGYDDPDVH